MAEGKAAQAGMKDGSTPAEWTNGTGAEGAAETASPAPQRVEIDVTWEAIGKVGGALLGVWLFSRVWPVLILVLLSLMLFATFNPVVRRLQARFPRPWALAAVITGIIIATALLLAIMLPPLVGQA